MKTVFHSIAVLFCCAILSQGCENVPEYDSSDVQIQHQAIISDDKINEREDATSNIDEPGQPGDNMTIDESLCDIAEEVLTEIERSRADLRDIVAACEMGEVFLTASDSDLPGQTDEKSRKIDGSAYDIDLRLKIASAIQKSSKGRSFGEKAKTGMWKAVNCVLGVGSVAAPFVPSGAVVSAAVPGSNNLTPGGGVSGGGSSDADDEKNENDSTEQTRDQTKEQTSASEFFCDRAKAAATNMEKCLEIVKDFAGICFTDGPVIEGDDSDSPSSPKNEESTDSRKQKK